MEQNSGPLETHGDHTGVSKASSELSEELTISVLKVTALGPLH